MFLTANVRYILEVDSGQINILYFHLLAESMGRTDKEAETFIFTTENLSDQLAGFLATNGLCVRLSSGRQVNVQPHRVCTLSEPLSANHFICECFALITILN